ncbi:unnamed protein product, partial [Meganyctiphanes norvegica]
NSLNMEFEMDRPPPSKEYEEVTALVALEFVRATRGALMSEGSLECSQRNLCEANAAAARKFGLLAEDLAEVFTVALLEFYPVLLGPNRQSLLLAGARGRQQGAYCRALYSTCGEDDWARIHKLQVRLVHSFKVEVNKLFRRFSEPLGHLKLFCWP